VPRLGPDQIQEIRNLFGSKTARHDWTIARLASAFGTSRANISRIVKDVAPGNNYRGMDGTGRHTDATNPWSEY
jgi:hypothetical protein